MVVPQTFAGGIPGAPAARLLRELLGITERPPSLVTLLHFAALQTAALVLRPRLGISPPVRTWGGKARAIALAAVHHVVYAVAAGSSTS